MYQFIQPSQYSISRKYPRQDYISQRYTILRDKLITYYQNKPKRISNSHVLVRLIKSIKSLKVDQTKSLLMQAESIRESALRMGNTFNMSTYGDVGNIRSSTFFGREDNETLLMWSYELKEESLKDWRRIAPVQVLCHDYQDMTPPFLNGDGAYGRAFYSIGTNVIAIDPALLYYMFRMWVREVWNTYPVGEKPTINNFVAQYVLPNMMDSYIECAYLNRVMTLMMDGYGSTPDSVSDHPIVVNDITPYVDDGIEYMLNSINIRTNAATLLSLYVAPTGRSLMDIWTLPDQPSTRAIEWVLTISRLSMMAFVVMRLSKHNMVGDKLLRNQLLRKIRQIKYNNVYPTVFGKETINIQTYIDEYIYKKISV